MAVILVVLFSEAVPLVLSLVTLAKPSEAQAYGIKDGGPL